MSLSSVVSYLAEASLICLMDVKLSTIVGFELHFQVNFFWKNENKNEEMFVRAVTVCSHLCFKHSEHKWSSLTAYCCIPLNSFNFWFITLIIFYTGLPPTFIYKVTLSKMEGKNSLCVLRQPALQFKTPFSCAVLANESGQPLNKSCQFPFRFIGDHRDLAGRQKCRPCGSSHSFRLVVISCRWK